MDNEYYSNFIDASNKAINNSSPGSYKLKEDDANTLPANSPLLVHLANSLCKSIENMDEELARFEKNYTSSNNSIFWATDYNDVFIFLKKIIKLQKARRVRLPNINSSTIFRELGIKYFLKDENLTLSDDADIQFFAVDMMFSDSGSLLLLNQSNNTLSKLTNTSTNIFFATIDRLCNSSSLAEILQQEISYRLGGARQDMIIFKSSPNCNNYLFIIDNQRTNILKDSFLRQSLTCINCGRCNDVCPIYQTIGDEPYNNVFVGPMASITLPYLETFESYKHIAYACTLCGQCEKVCPLALPLRDLIIHVRSSFLAEGILDKSDRRLMAVMRKISFSRNKLNGSRFLKKHLFLKHASPSLRKNRSLPPLAHETFNKSFKKKQNNA